MKIKNTLFFLLFCSGLFASDMSWRKAYTPASDDWKKVSQHFVFNNDAEPESLDPAIVTGVSEFRVLDALYEGLTTYDPATLEPRPGVAHLWNVSDDGLVYTFHLRQDARYSDGKPVTARHFLQAWKRVLTPSTLSQYSYLLYEIENAEAYFKGEIKDFSKVGIEVRSDHELIVRLRQPCPWFLDLTAFATFYPVRLDVIEEHPNSWTDAGKLVGNGAFVLSEWKPRQLIEMTKNPQYHDRNFVKLDKITSLPYDDLNTALMLFREKKIDWLPSLPHASKVEELRRDPDYYVMPYLGSYFYRFNCSKPPFDDPKIRRAFSLAVDRNIITDEILRGGQKPAAHYCPPMNNYYPIEGAATNRVKAMQLMNEAGYGPDGKIFPQVEILYNTSENHKKVAEALAYMWRETLGIRVLLRNAEWKVYLSEQKNMNYDISRASWIGDYSDPSSFFDLFVTDGSNNRTGWGNAEYDSLMRQTRSVRDPQKRELLFQKAERILVEEEFPILPLYIYVNQGMLSERVGGWYENVRDIHPFKYIWMDF